MKVYISGAINGTDDYMERFAKAEKYLKELGYSVVNPAKVNAQLPSDTDYDDYMKMSLCMLSMCEAIYLLRGFEESRGAKRELEFAKSEDMEIIYE